MDVSTTAREYDGAGAAMFRAGTMAVVVSVLLSGLSAVAEEKPGDGAAAASRGQTVVRGRLSCSLNRAVAFPFRGTIKEIRVQNGQRVRGGDVLLRYALTVEETASLNRRVAPDAIDDMLVNLLDLTKNRNLLENQREETVKLQEQNLVSTRKLQQIDEELKIVRMRLDVVNKRLARENKLLENDLQLLKDLTGETINCTNVPAEVSLVAPIEGHVLSMNPAVRVNAETLSGGTAFTIGVMDPMLLRCQVHEQDAAHIALGDPAVFVPESVQGRKFRAKVSLVSLQPTADDTEEPSYYDVELTIPNPDAVLRDGFQGEVTFGKAGKKGGE